MSDNFFPMNEDDYSEGRNHSYRPPSPIGNLSLTVHVHYFNAANDLQQTPDAPTDQEESEFNSIYDRSWQLTAYNALTELLANHFGYDKAGIIRNLEQAIIHAETICKK